MTCFYAITILTNNEGAVVCRQAFDPWGRRRDPASLATDDNALPAGYSWLRGFTGHEHLPQFKLINMNARLYDPILGRMLSPDNYVTDASNPMTYNLYSYADNNPISYVDPDGNFAFVAAAIIGAAIGAYIGGSTANGSYDPTQWEYGSGKTWSYMLAGGIVGAASATMGAAVAASGMPFANTAGLVSASYMNSVGTTIYTGGQTSVSIGLGAASYNMTEGSFGYLGKKGNSALENIGYGMGALANVADVLAGFKPSSFKLRTENDPDYFKNTDASGNPISQKDNIGHSQITTMKDQPVVDWGPTKTPTGFTKSVPGTNSYTRVGAIPTSKMKWDPVTISGVNSARMNGWNPSGRYNLAFNSCVNQTSRALNSSGVFNIGFHPYVLHAQMYLRSIGVRPVLFSSTLYQY